MACNTICKGLQGPIQYKDALGNNTPYYTEPDTGKRVLSPNKCGTVINMPCPYVFNDPEVSYIYTNGNCPDWCSVSNAILQIADNTYQTNGSTVATPTTPAPLGFLSDALALAGGMLVGEVYYNTTTGTYDVVC
jgi:hypothetical protein